MSSTTPLATSVPNEGTTRIKSLKSDQPISKNRRFSAGSVIPPLLLISTVSVALGLAPYFRLRHHILRQSGVMQTIRSSIEDGNRRLLEHIRTRDMEAAARQMEHQKSQVELQLKIEELDRRYREVEALSKRLSVMQGELDKSMARNQEMEGLLGDMGEQTGAQLGQVAAFIEDFQLKEGQPDRFGVARMRQLALLLQSRHSESRNNAQRSS